MITLGGGVGLPLGLDQAVQRCGIILDVILDGSAEFGTAITAVGRQPFQGLLEIVCGRFMARWCGGIGGGP